jgi:hypothetical protein
MYNRGIGGSMFMYRSISSTNMVNHFVRQGSSTSTALFHKKEENKKI